MDNNSPYSDFFLKPTLSEHCRYEILRARFVENRTAEEIACCFSKKVSTVHSYCAMFKQSIDNANPRPFFRQNKPGPKSDRKKSNLREHIIGLRERGYANTDIHKALAFKGHSVSLSLIDQVLRENKLIGMRKRTRQERERIAHQIETGRIPGLGDSPDPEPEKAVVADVNQLDLSEDRTLYTRSAGIFLFLPFLLKIQADKIVEKANLVDHSPLPVKGDKGFSAPIHLKDIPS